MVGTAPRHPVQRSNWRRPGICVTLKGMRISPRPALRLLSLWLTCAGAAAGLARAETVAETPANAAAEPSAQALFDPATGLRISAYRAPVPPQAPGARTLRDASAVEALARDGALLLDVLGAAGARMDAQAGWIVPARHQTLPGAIWLPEIGRGVQAPEIAAYMRQALALCTGGDQARAIVVFCRSDCWMSWNAVQHIAAAGYDNIYWYPGGSDDWAEAGRPTLAARPLDPGAASCLQVGQDRPSHRKVSR